jgi:hypothetical protein
LQRERYPAESRIVGQECDPEAGLAAHGQHPVVLREHVALDPADAFGARIADDTFQQRLADPLPLQVGADDQAVLGGGPVWIAGQAADARKFTGGSAIATKAMSRS